MTRLKELFCILTWHKWHTHEVYVGYKAIEPKNYEVLSYEHAHCKRCDLYTIREESLGVVNRKPTIESEMAREAQKDTVWN
jgi:hypothetical protein